MYGWHQARWDPISSTRHHVHTHAGITTPTVFLLIQQTQGLGLRREAFTLSKSSNLRPCFALRSNGSFCVCSQTRWCKRSQPQSYKILPLSPSLSLPQSLLCLRALTSDSRFKRRLYQWKRHRITDACKVAHKGNRVIPEIRETRKHFCRGIRNSRRARCSGLYIVLPDWVWATAALIKHAIWHALTSYLNKQPCENAQMSALKGPTTKRRKQKSHKATCHGFGWDVITNGCSATHCLQGAILIE